MQHHPTIVDIDELEVLYVAEEEVIAMVIIVAMVPIMAMVNIMVVVT